MLLLNEYLIAAWWETGSIQFGHPRPNRTGVWPRHRRDASNTILAGFVSLVHLSVRFWRQQKGFGLDTCVCGWACGRRAIVAYTLTGPGDRLDAGARHRNWDCWFSLGSSLLSGVLYSQKGGTPCPIFLCLRRANVPTVAGVSLAWEIPPRLITRVRVLWQTEGLIIVPVQCTGHDSVLRLAK